jgi:hypothetical protein
MSNTDLIENVYEITFLQCCTFNLHCRPKFNKKEYQTEINENSPIGTPLSDLDMVVSDSDTVSDIEMDG